MNKNGVLPDQAIKDLAAGGAILTPHPFDADQIQPASLDLRLGDKAYRLRASFLPGSGMSVERRLTSSVMMHELDLSAGAVGAIAWLGVIELLGAIPLVTFGPKLPPYFAIPCVFAWGAGAMSYYGLCVAHATDRAPPDQAARVVAGLLFVWSAGSILGPGVAGAAFDSPLGGRGLFGVAIFGAVTLILSMWGRSLGKAAAEVVSKVPFFASPPNPSVAMAEMVGDSASDERLPPSKPQ